MISSKQNKNKHKSPVHSLIQKQWARGGEIPSAPKRQRELQGFLDQWAQEQDHGKRRGPFDFGGGLLPPPVTLQLTGADVSWLAEQKGYDVLTGESDLHLEALYVNTP